MQTYEHRQLSPWMLLPLVLVAVAFALFGLGDTLNVLSKLAAFLVVAVATTMFSTLTTDVDSRRVAWWFTFGFPGGEIYFPDIANLELTRTSFWEGFGIHWTFGHGWLWNVSGFNAVMITKRDGKRITLGTDDPHGLYEAIKRFQLQAVPAAGYVP
jgi:hypothetical protein